MEEIFILLADSAGTTHSIDEPIGLAVTTEEEAQLFVLSNWGYSQSYRKVRVFKTLKEALEYKK